MNRHRTLILARMAKGMRRFDSAELFFYGTIRALKYLRAGVPFRDYGEMVTDLMTDLYNFYTYHNHRRADGLEELDELRNTITAAESLYSFVRGTLYPLRDQELNDTHITLLRDVLSEFETALKLDLGALPVYLLENKRGYSARQFITGIGARVVLSKNNRELLSPRCLDDIDHAGKCLIHEQYTAAGFHTMRAIEEIARRYYKTVTGDDPIDVKGNPFPLGGLVHALEGKLANLSKGGKDTDRLSQDILPVLKRIVKTYRNPIMHPQMTLEEDAAIDVFDNAKSAIASIFRDIDEAKHRDAWNAAQRA